MASLDLENMRLLCLTIGFETGSQSSTYTNFSYNSPSDTQSHMYRNPTDNTWKYWSSGWDESYTNGCNNLSYMPTAKFKTLADGSPAHDKARFEKK